MREPTNAARIKKRHWTAILSLTLVAIWAGQAPAQSKPSDYDPFRDTGSSDKRSDRAAPAAPSKNTITSVSFVDTPITTVFKMISDLTGWSILMSPEVSRQPPRINLWVKNLTPEEVLDQVVQLVALKHAEAKNVVALLKPFTEKDAHSQILPVDRGNQVVLLVPKPLLESMEQLIQAVDVPLASTDDHIKIIPLQYQEAPAIVPVLEKFVSGAMRQGKASDAGRAKPGEAAESRPAEGETEEVLGPYQVQFMVEPVLNLVVIRGTTKDVRRVEELLAKLDVPTDVTVVSYAVKYTDAKDVYVTLQQIIQSDSALRGGTGAPPRCRVAMNEQSARIVVEGTSKDHARIAKLIEAIDQALPPGKGGVRAYRLENVAAEEVAGVLRDLIGETTAAKGPRRADLGRSVLLPAEGGVVRVRPPEAPVPSGDTRTPAPTGESPSPVSPGGEPSASANTPPPRVIVAPGINAVIIKGTASDQEDLGSIIRELDKPRDQVMLEVTLVTVRSNSGFNFGLEIGQAELGKKFGTIGFTQYGIGAVDTAAGTIRLPIAAQDGLNYSIFYSSDFSLVLHALKTVGETRVTSSPKVLVEDNSKATIKQNTQEPFQVVSQGTTTTEKSFGGFVEAGTTLSVMASISSEDWLRLMYEVSFSSFGDRPDPSLPPAKRESTLNGLVRIPAGYTVVLGGLVGTSSIKTKRGIPGVMDIPQFGDWLSHLTDTEFTETLFVFIRPVILRDSGFQDLMLLSKIDVRRAKLAQVARLNNPLKMLVPPSPARAIRQKER
ncbi:MAG: hypothetical protein NT031_13695 [Planctomycetota bacterium]|nr:hypothetical protein [Planctomycetota bacterium]